MKENKLGLGSAIAVCAGLIVATSCLVLLGQGIGLAGKGFIFSMFIVLILNTFIALSFGELHGLMPNIEGGLGQYTKVGLGPVASIISNTSAYVITNILAASVEVTISGMVINQLFLPMIPTPVISIALLVILTLVNYMGVDIFSKIQNIVVTLLLGSLILLGIISFFKLGIGTVIDPSQQTAPMVTGIGGYISLTALAFWLFIGIEYIIPLSKNLKNPKRDVTLAMVLTVLILFFIQIILGAGMTNYVTLEQLVSSELPHMIFARNVLGTTGEMWMGIISILAGISTANTVLSSVTRILSGMAETDMMPAIFQKKNKSNTPVAGLLLITISITILVTTGFTQTNGLVNMLLAASCFWLTSYILVNITTLILRKRYPDHPGRNKKLVFGGVPQIIGIIANIYMIWNIAQGDARIVIYKLYLIIFAILVVYSVVWVKFIKKQPMFKGAELDEINGVNINTLYKKVQMVTNLEN